MQAPTAADATAVHARHWIIDQTKRGFPVPEADTLISNPTFGPVDTAAGLDAAADRLGDSATVFVQGTGADRRLVAGRVRPRPRQVLPLRRHRLPVAALPAAEVGAGDGDLGADHYTIFLDGRRSAPRRRPAGSRRRAFATAAIACASSRPTGASRRRRRRRLRSASTTRPLRCTSRCADPVGR
jgi:hypothetical protein